MAKAIHGLLPLLFLLFFEVSAWPTDYSSQEKYPADDAIGNEPSSKDIQQTLEHLARSGNMRNSANWLRGPPPKPSTLEGIQEEENGQIEPAEYEDGHGNNIEEEDDEDKGDEDKHEEDEYEDGDGEDEAVNEEGDEKEDEKHQEKEDMPHEPNVHEQGPDVLEGPFGLGPNVQMPRGPENPNGILHPEESDNPAGGMPSLPSGLNNRKASKRGNRVKRQTGGIEGPEGPPDKEYPDGQQEGPNGQGNGEGEGEYPENEMEEENDNIPTTTGRPTTQPRGNGGQVEDDDDPRDELEEGGNVTGNNNVGENGTTNMPNNGENIVNESESITQSLPFPTSATPMNTTSSIPSATEDENLGEDENEDEADQGEAETNVITTTPPVGPENPNLGGNQQEANDEVGNTGTTSLPIGNVTGNVPDGEKLGENKEENGQSQASTPPVDVTGVATSTTASQNQTVSQEDLGEDYQDDNEEATTQLPAPPTGAPGQLETSTFSPEEVGEDQEEDISNEGTTIKASTLLPGGKEVDKDEVENERNEASSTVQPSTSSINSVGSELQESANTQLPMPSTNSTAVPEDLGDDVPEVDSEETSTQLPSPPTESTPSGVPESGELGGGEQESIDNQTLTTLPLNETSTNAGPMGDEDLGEDEEESGESQANTPPFDATEIPLATSTAVANITQTAGQEDLGDAYQEESGEATTQLPAPPIGIAETSTPAGPEVGKDDEENGEHNATATVTQMSPPPIGYPFTGIPLSTNTQIPAGADELGEEDNGENALNGGSTTQSSSILNGTTVSDSGLEGLSDVAAEGKNASQETSTSKRNLTSSQPTNPMETTISPVEDAQQSSTQLPSPPVAATEVTGGNITPSSIGTPNDISAEQIGGDELESDEIDESTHLPNEEVATQIPTISSTPLASDANEEVGEDQEEEGDSGERKSDSTQMPFSQIELTTHSGVEIPPPPSEASGGITSVGDEQILNATSPKPTNEGIEEVGEDQEDGGDSGEKKASKGTQMPSPQIGTATPSCVEEIGEDNEEEGNEEGLNPSTQIPPPPSEASGGITPSGDEQVLNATSPKPTNGGIEEVGEDQEDSGEKKASEGTEMPSQQNGTATPSGVEEVGDDEEDEGNQDGMNPSTQIPPPLPEASAGITPSGDEQVLNSTSPKPTNGGIEEVGEDEEDGDDFELGGKPSTDNVTENPLIGLSTPVNGSIVVTPMPTGPQDLHPEGNGEAGANEEENDGPEGGSEEEQGEGNGPDKDDANPQKPSAEKPGGGGEGSKPGQEGEQSGEKPNDENGPPQPSQPPQKEAGTTGQTQEDSDENGGQQGQGGQGPESGVQPQTEPQQPAGPGPILPGQDGGQPVGPLPGDKGPWPAPGQVEPGGHPIPGGTLPGGTGQVGPGTVPGSPGQVGPAGPWPGSADGSWPGGPGGLQTVGPPINPNVPNGQGPDIPAGGQGPETQPILPNDQEGPESEGSEEDATTMIPGSSPASEDVEPTSAPVTASPDLTSPAPLSPPLVGTSPPNSNNNNATVLDCTNGKGQKWGDWSPTGPCTADCGACGLVQRTRECLSFQEGRGCPCHGDYKVTEPCNIGVCQYPHPSCCMPYNLIYVEGKFACGPHENEEIVKQFIEESNGNKTVGAQRMGLRDRVNRRLFFRRRRK